MAVSNCLGSNIFDITVSLGLPWLLHVLISHEYTPIPLYDDVSSVAISLVASAFILFTFIFLNQFNFNKIMGGLFVLGYIGFITFDIIFDSQTSLPTCESKSK